MNDQATTISTNDFSAYLEQLRAARARIDAAEQQRKETEAKAEVESETAARRKNFETTRAALSLMDIPVGTLTEQDDHIVLAGKFKIGCSHIRDYTEKAKKPFSDATEGTYKAFTLNIHRDLPLDEHDNQKNVSGYRDFKLKDGKPNDMDLSGFLSLLEQIDQDYDARLKQREVWEKQRVEWEENERRETEEYQKRQQASVETPEPPTIESRLLALIREIVRDELAQRDAILDY